MMNAGACQCGSVTYRLSSEGPLTVYACHCLNCQTRSGSAFGLHALLSQSDFECAGGTVAYSYSFDGVGFEERVCETCHTRIYNRNDAMPGMVFLRAGTLAASHRLEPIAHIWTCRKQPWILLPEATPSFDKSPTPEQFGKAIEAANGRVDGPTRSS